MPLYLSLADFQSPSLSAIVTLRRFLRPGVGDQGGACGTEVASSFHCLLGKDRPHENKGVICICQARAADHICIYQMADVP